MVAAGDGGGARGGVRRAPPRHAGRGARASRPGPPFPRTDRARPSGAPRDERDRRGPRRLPRPRARRRAPRASVALPGRRASPIARCCSPRSPAGDTTVRGTARRRRRRPDAGRAGGAGHPRRARRRRRATSSCTGRAGPSRPVPPRLFLGNAGTALRPLTAVARARRRPLRALGRRPHARAARSAISSMRCACSAPTSAISATTGFPPLGIGPGRAGAAGTPDRVAVRGDVSSQFTSALLMALPLVTATRRARSDGRHRRRARSRSPMSRSRPT